MTADAKREAWWWLQARATSAAGRTKLLRGSAVIWGDVGRAELVPVEVPSAGRGQVTLAVSSSIVSAGTERAQYLRLPNARVGYPHRPGYSAAGIVLAVGRDVDGVQPGDRVAARGVHHASVATVPAEAVVPVPDGVDMEDAALMQLGTICGQGVRRAALSSGEPFCVVGAGLIGILTQRIAAAEGAGPATMIAKSRSKEPVALAGGVERFLDLDDLAEIAVLAAPVVIEATGDPDALHVAVAAAGHGGRIVLLGSPRGVTGDVPLDLIRAKQLTIVGAHVELLTREFARSGEDGYRRESSNFLELLARGVIYVRDLVALAVDPREADAFYRDLSASREIIGACFDWTRLPSQATIGPAHLVRIPDMWARGIDSRRHLLRGDARRRTRSAYLEPEDPFADAVGRLRIGLLGCGDIATHNADAIAEAPNAELIACYDPVRALAEEVALPHGADVAPSVEALLERRDVDCVFLSVPHHLHAPLALEAIEAGKHVIVEKPLSNTLSSGFEMVEAAEAAGVTLSVCFPHRYQPNVAATRRLIREGALGEFSGVLVNLFSDKPASYWLGGFSGRSSSNWRGSRELAGGGFLIMNLSHLLDLIGHLTGIQPELCCAFTSVVDGPSEVEDTVTLSISYANGATGTVFGSSALRGNRLGRTEFHVWGPDGYVTVEPDPKIYTLRAIDGLQPSRWCSLENLPGRNIRAAYVSRFASAVTRGEQPDVNPTQALGVQALIEAAYRSAETSSPVQPSDLLSRIRA